MSIGPSLAETFDGGGRELAQPIYLADGVYSFIAGEL